MMQNTTNDDGSITIRCSNCSAPLVELWQRNPNAHQETTIRASCAHCGDKSFKEVVIGTFYSGSTDFSGIDAIDIEKDQKNSDGIRTQTILIKTTKAKNYG